MQKEEIIVTQKIKICFNSEEARKKCVEKIKKGTDWSCFYEGLIKGDELQYSASKSQVVSVK